MRRIFTLVGLIGLAVPAGISISGCTRNPAGKYCDVTSGYGLLTTQVASITLQPQQSGISLAYGQTMQLQSPTAYSCLQQAVSVSSKSYQYGTTVPELVDVSPTGELCAGTWNRNSGGGTPDYTYCNYPNPQPTTKGLPYAVAYVTAAADSVVSNPVAVYVHAPVTSVSLAPTGSNGLPVGPTQCLSQGQIAQLDAEACYSISGVQYELCAPANVSASGNYACPGGLAPGVKAVPTCESAIGTLSFTASASSVATINATNNQITAEQPGTTAITASIAGTASSAGYFSTCPPASISVTLANGATSGTITQGVPQNLTTTVFDTNGKQINGLALSYQSTNPIDITAGSGGVITTNFPGQASINAICQPGTCNPAPINQFGLNGTGLSLTSNAVNITTPGTASDYLWFGAPGNSEYFVPVELISGTVGSTVRLPYVPNSMMMDRTGTTLYFGSARELISFSTANDSLSAQNPAAPGVVLAVAPDNSKVLVNDQAQHLFYIVAASGGSTITSPGMGNAAQWTPDGQTLYITDNAELNTPASCGTALITGHTNTLYIYNSSTGWSTYPLPPSPLPPSEIPSCTAQPNTAAGMPASQQTPAILIPSVGAYLRGAINTGSGATPATSGTVAHTWCPSGTVGNQASIQYYPLGDSQAVDSDVLAATVEGHHVLGAECTACTPGGGITLSDIALNIPGTTTNGIVTPAACSVTTSGSGTSQVQTMQPLTLTPLSVHQLTLNGVTNATSVNEVVTGSTPVPTGGGAGTSLAFVTYNGASTGASLPYYIPASGGAVGTQGLVTLSDCPPTLAPNNTPNPAYPCNSTITGPVAGAFSPDNTLFFVSTAGDNMVHYITIPPTLSPTSAPTDSQQISPNLPACNPGTDAGCTYTGSGTIVPATVIEVKPRSVT